MSVTGVCAVQNARPTYIETYISKLINWSAVAARYEAACT
jgi:superoxide dismutase